MKSTKTKTGDYVKIPECVKT